MRREAHISWFELFPPDAAFISKDSFSYEMRPNVRKRILVHVRLAKIQIRLRIRAVWSESSLGML